MIAGFNTDIEFGGTVYHVQTEDKGAPANMIMSLVYDRGTILASKRAKYDDLADAGLDEKELAERLSRQHKLMCAAVKAGRISELVEMTRKTAGAKALAELQVAESVSVVEPAGAVPISQVPPAQVSLQPPATAPRIDPIPPRAPINIAIVESERPVTTVEDLAFDDLPVIEAEIIEDIEILPDDAVAVVSELSGQARPANQKLSLEMLGETKFKGGERKSITVMLCRGTDRKVVADAQIMVKILGSAFRPVIFHARTDANGLARVHLQLPHFQAGRAALLLRAISGGEEIELRKIVTPG